MPLVNRALTADGDLLYQSGKQVLIEDRDAVAQGIWVAIQTIQGDDQFFPEFGLDLDNISGTSEDTRQAELRDGILRSGRVRRIIEITVPADPDRRRRFQYTVRAIDRNDREVLLGVNLGV